jgi:hypothetical protein
LSIAYAASIETGSLLGTLNMVFSFMGVVAAFPNEIDFEWMKQGTYSNYIIVLKKFLHLIKYLK